MRVQDRRGPGPKSPMCSRLRARTPSAWPSHQRSSLCSSKRDRLPALGDALARAADHVALPRERDSWPCPWSRSSPARAASSSARRACAHGGRVVPEVAVRVREPEVIVPGERGLGELGDERPRDGGGGPAPRRGGPAEPARGRAGTRRRGAGGRPDRAGSRSAAARASFSRRTASSSAYPRATLSPEVHEIGEGPPRLVGAREVMSEPVVHLVEPVPRTRPRRASPIAACSACWRGASSASIDGVAKARSA